MYKRQDFANKGISKDQIPELIMRAIKQSKIIGTAGRNREVYEVSFRGKILTIAITISENGFIVGANPVSAWKSL